MEILREITGKKRDRRYSYWQYLEYLCEGTHSESEQKISQPPPRAL